MKLSKTLEAVRKAALAYPDTREDHPWGEIAIKVKEKVFVFMGPNGFGVKLPKSGPGVLKKKLGTPTHYGLGKHGWVSFEDSSKIKLADALGWLDESFRAVAPKKVLAKLVSGSRTP